MNGRRATRVIGAIALVGAVLAARAHAGAWATYQRPVTFSDLLCEGDTLWCATGEAGLFLYRLSTDTFTPVSPAPDGLASRHLACLARAGDGRLWVGTRGAGASVLSADRTSWTLMNQFDGLPSDSVLTMTAEGDSLWIGTQRGVAVWDGHQISGTLPDGVNPSPFPTDVVTGIVLRGDSVWVATTGGIRVRRRSDLLAPWTPADSGLLVHSVDHLVSDGTSLIALSRFATYRWSDAAAKWVLFGGIGAVRSLAEDRGVILAGADLGLERWNGNGWSNVNPALVSSGASPMQGTVDPTGRIYAAGRPQSSATTAGTGLYRQPDGGVGAWGFAFPPGPPDNDCLNLDVEGERLYVTTYGNGIGRLGESGWTNWFPSAVGDTSSAHFRRPIFDFGMLIDTRSFKWFGSWAPIDFENNCAPDTGSVDVLDDGGGGTRIRHIPLGPTKPEARRSFWQASSLDSAGGHWFGLTSPCPDVGSGLEPAGLEYYAGGNQDSAYFGNFSTLSGTVTTPPGGNGGLPSNAVLALVADRQHRLWIGTKQGLCVADSVGIPGRTVAVPLPIKQVADDAPRGQVIRGLAAYGDLLWVFDSGQVLLYDVTTGDAASSPGFLDLPFGGGPAANAVRPMDVGVDGTLYLGTTAGVRAYRNVGGITVATDYTSENSPLADDEVRTIRVDRRTGVVWIATAGGVSRFDPGYVAPAPALPTLAATIYPNPARLSSAALSIRLSGNATTYTGRVYDLSGRVVHRFEAHANGRVVWNGRDDTGHLVQPGVYFVRTESAGRHVVSRLVLLH